MPMSSHKKKLLTAIMLVFFSISLAILGIELAFLFFSPVKFHSFVDSSTKDWRGSDIFLNIDVARPSTTLGYEWRPNIKGGLIETNSLGMLDRERSKIKPQGVYRIIFLGDSTTANSSYVAILEKILNKNKEREEFEVWNCAVTGYTGIQSCRALKQKWLKCDPDMVVIGFCLNDFMPTPLVLREGNNLVGYFPHREMLSAVSPFLLKNSALYRFIVMRVFFSKNKDYHEEITKTTAFHLQEAKELCSAQGIDFLIVILGITKRFEDSNPAWKDHYLKIKKIADEYNIRSLDIVPIFQNNNPESLMLLDELHFNLKGNEIVARTIRDYLRQNLEKQKE